MVQKRLSDLLTMFPRKLTSTLQYERFANLLTIQADSLFSVHDLMEAYSILSTRLRVVFNEATCTTLPITSLAGFHEFSSDIMHCISRDIQRPLPSPFDSQQDFSSYLDYEAATDLEELQLTMDNISLCHYAFGLLRIYLHSQRCIPFFPVRSYFIALVIYILILPSFLPDDSLVSPAS